MQRLPCCWTVAVVAAILGGARSQALADPGLLLIAHGSPRAEWNSPLLDFGRRIAEEVAKGGRFKAVRTAMLEAAKPDVPTAVAELEAAGCDRIVAVPLFVAPSGHTHFDVPAALGIYWSEIAAAAMAAEGVKPARPKVPITIVPPLSESEVLSGYALDQVKKLSRSPKEEALVILLHGNAEYAPRIDQMLRQVSARCCGETGIGYSDWASIGVGQEYRSNGLAAIQSALEHKKRVIVVGLYISSSIAKIHQRSLGGKQGTADSDPLRGKDVVFSGDPIVTHPELPRWVLQVAHAAIAAEK